MCRCDLENWQVGIIWEDSQRWGEGSEVIQKFPKYAKPLTKMLENGQEIIRLFTNLFLLKFRGHQCGIKFFTSLEGVF